MPNRYSTNDPYTYDDSPVLKNKGNFCTDKELAEYEILCVTRRMVEDPPDGGFDYAHLKRLHHHLFQDVYEWAGRERDVHISKGNSRFATPVNIRPQAEALFAQLASEDFLVGLDLETFASRAAYYVSELNALHPFREGNGRVIRLFLFLLAEKAGFDLDPNVLETRWLNASIEAFTHDESMMTALLTEALSKFEE